MIQKEDMITIPKQEYLRLAESSNLINKNDFDEEILRVNLLKENEESSILAEENIDDYARLLGK